MTNRNATILIVEDEAKMRRLLELNLGDRERRVGPRARRGRPDLVVPGVVRPGGRVHVRDGCEDPGQA